MSAPSRGRRPGAPDTRAEILAAARELFADRGVTGTSVRAVAAKAGVDPALVHHYFGTKDALFMAALEVPFDPKTLMAPVIAAGPEGAAERVLRVFVATWDDPQNQPALLALFRSMTEPSGERLLGEGFLPVVLLPLARALGLDQPEVRVPLLASQVLGLILCRYVLRVEPLASMSADQLVAAYAPGLQRFMTGDVTGAPES